jgi:hypothetical protein
LATIFDIRGQQVTRSDVYASEPYDASQKLGEEVRSSGGVGPIYNSLRRQNVERVFNPIEKALGEAEDQAGANELSPPILGSAHPALFLRVAGKILECAQRGDKTLSGLTAAGYAAATRLSGRRRVAK